MTTSTPRLTPRWAHLADLGRCYVLAGAGIGVVTAVIAVGWLVPVERAMAMAVTAVGVVLLVTGGGVVKLRGVGDAGDLAGPADRAAGDQGGFGEVGTLSSLGVALLVGLPLLVAGTWLLSVADGG
ncbi:hypothetical protein [Euzebya sp.]|uniref:hypothetical protein n=1 Tax=Euzebya sp. TaxID=1971409 RepID=UPI0035175D6D